MGTMLCRLLSANNTKMTNPLLQTNLQQMQDGKGSDSSSSDTSIQDQSQPRRRRLPQAFKLQPQWQHTGKNRPVHVHHPFFAYPPRAWPKLQVLSPQGMGQAHHS